MSTPHSKRRHEFQNAAKRFRAGKISLAEFSELFFPVEPDAVAHAELAGTAFGKLPPRQSDCHKGTFGHVLLVAGSGTMSGAAALAGLAALRGGAGLVTVATSPAAQPIVAQHSPCLMTLPLASDSQGWLTENAWETIANASERATCVAIGPGLGQTDGVRKLVRRCFESLSLPMIVDADALNALAGAEELSRPAGPRVFTPHPGELRRLIEVAGTARENLEAAAHDWMAARTNTRGEVLVLKGPATLITDGKRQHHNRSGTPALATAGSGDVLTGVLAALIAQGLPPWDAACLGTMVHGFAGQKAAERRGDVGTIATDLIDWLPIAIREHAVGDSM